VIGGFFLQYLYNAFQNYFDNMYNVHFEAILITCRWHVLELFDKMNVGCYELYF
jgi:hypothetical protein